MWKKLLITGCMAFCLLGGSALSAQPSCETKEEVTSEQLNRTKKGLDAAVQPPHTIPDESMGGSVWYPPYTVRTDAGL